MKRKGERMVYSSRFLVKSLVWVLSVGAVSSASAFFGSKTMVLPRSPNINAARHMVGWQDQINRAQAPDKYWSLLLLLNINVLWVVH